MLVVGVLIGMSTALLCKMAVTRLGYGQFGVEKKDDDLLIRLRGKPILRLRDEVTHYKFFVTGESTQWQRAMVVGSMEPAGPVALAWKKASSAKSVGETRS